MHLDRRDFMKLAAATGATCAFGGLGLDTTEAVAQAGLTRLAKTKQTTSVCCYCSVGCGLIVHTGENGRAVNVEGDPDHPINEGSLCPKGASHWQLTENDRRVTKVQYRAPYSTSWEEKPWDWAIARIAKLTKATRDASFETKDAKGRTVNRTNGICHVGSAALDNEECWILQEMQRAMGLVTIEHQARL